MTPPISRRSFLRLAAAPGATLLAGPAEAGHRAAPDGWVRGKLTGAEALVATLQAEDGGCVFGIPGAQENELWDTFKSRHQAYLLATNELAAASMADGFARATGRPGVLCVVPGPGITNALSGLGEALLDSVPIVVIAGDVARGDRYRAFQVHDLPNADLLRPVTKEVFTVSCVTDIPTAVRAAFQKAREGEPGPAAVVVPYDLLVETAHFSSAPLGDPPKPFDQAAFDQAITLLADRRLRIGIYAGQGCMNATAELAEVAELLSAPVSTSVSGKGVISDTHPFSVGYGYGPFGSRTAEAAFHQVDLVLAIGVRYSEVATAFYNIPRHRFLIHVDINPNNLGRNVPAAVCVCADAGLFLNALLARSTEVARPQATKLVDQIRARKEAERKHYSRSSARHGVDPMILLRAIRESLGPDGMVFVDVTLTEHWAAETFPVYQPRTYFNPTDNQSMGWSIPAAMGAQVAYPERQVVTVTGDGCFFMSAMELANAARACLPIKVFIIDDQKYEYMRRVQQPAYLRSTATLLPRLDYAALAQALGVGYQEICANAELSAGIGGALTEARPMLIRVVTDYGTRQVRWISATKERYLSELSTAQKMRFLGRLTGRAIDMKRELND